MADDFNYDRSKNLRPKRNIRTAMNHEIMMYAIAQKEGLGFDKAVEECKYRASLPSQPRGFHHHPPALPRALTLRVLVYRHVSLRRAAQRALHATLAPRGLRACSEALSVCVLGAQMLILPPQMLLYMALAPEEKMTYKEAGPAGQATFEAGVAGVEARAFRGCGVFTSEPFEVSDDQDSVQMLTRSTQVGEFYVMMPPQISPGDNPQDTTHTCDLLIYDEESDKHVRISWSDALAACCLNLGAADGKIDVSGLTLEGGITGTNWLAAAQHWAAYNAGIAFGGKYNINDKGKVTAAAAGTFTMPASYAVMEKDIRIVLARPFIEHLMHSAILTVSGRDTGATLFGPADMQLSVRQIAHLLFVAVSNRLFLFLGRPTPKSRRSKGISHALQPFKNALSNPPPKKPLPKRAQALHGPLQGRGHEAAERLRDARCCVLRLRRRLQHAFLCQGRKWRIHTLHCVHKHDEAPLLFRRRRRTLRIDAGLPRARKAI